MNSLRVATILLCFVLGGHALAQTNDMDSELSVLADKLATLIKDNAKKKVTVLDFTDLQGGSTELGRYIAEQLSVNLVMNKRQFAVLDRANLKSILAEHKLTATGLVDPENAKKLGQFAGVDALILGNIIPKSANNISLTAKIITTDTAEIVGAARAQFKSDDNVQHLVSKPTTPNSAVSLQEDKAKVVRTFGDLRVEIQSLKIVEGKQYLLTLSLSNQSQKKSLWAGISSDLQGEAKGVITDASGNRFVGSRQSLTGIALASYSKFSYRGEGISDAEEIKPGGTASGTIQFFSRYNQTPTTGQCNLQLEFVYGQDFKDSFGKGSVQNLITKIEAE